MYAVQVTGQSFVRALVLSAAPYELPGGEAVFVARLTIAPDGSVAGPMGAWALKSSAWR